MIAIDDLYKQIPEKKLLDNYKRINMSVRVYGKVPPTYNTQLYEIEPNHSGEYNFTNSFVYYMKYNKTILPFDVDVVTTPSFEIFYMDKTYTPPTNSMIGTCKLNLKVKNCIVKTMKLPISISADLIEQLDFLGISPFYNQLLTGISNQIKLSGFDKKLYFYRLSTTPITYNPNTFQPVRSFIMRFAIDIKAFN